MRRIIHVASGREWRGGQRQTWLLARELQRMGVDQLLVTGRGSELARRAKVDGVPVREIGWTLGVDPRAWWAVRDEARRVPSLLHAHDGHAVTITNLAAGRDIPWIATRRNATPLRHPATWDRARLIVAISRAVEEQLRLDGINVMKVRVVPSGIDLAATRATPSEDLRAWAGVPPQVPIILTIAALTLEKGLLDIPVVLAEVLQHRDVHWIIVGEGPLREQLEGLGAHRAVGGRLHLPGHHPDPIRLLRGADLFVFPSTSEGLGTSVLDALALDIPVVATNAGGLVDILKGGAGVMVPVGDESAMIDAIERMLTDAKLRERCIQAGRVAADWFTAARMAERMEKVYSSVDANH